ncbi:MAG: hypothetical protein ABL921_09975 [Pirellula sp.]
MLTDFEYRYRMVVVIHCVFQAREGHVKVYNNQLVTSNHWLAGLVQQSCCTGIVVVLPEDL